MSMDTDARRTMSQRMTDAAEARTCLTCGRRGALVTRDLGDRIVTYCKWANEKLCMFKGTSS